MFADALNLIIAKKIVEENWKIIDNRKYKKTISKYRPLQTNERLQN